VFERSVVVGDEPIPYYYGFGCADDLVNALAAELKNADAGLLIADRAVAPFAKDILGRLAESMTMHVYFLDAEERNKTLGAVQSVIDFAVDRRLTRDSFFLAMGGGLTGNIAGLAASLIYRGVRFAHLPTTSVAAFDSVLSLKQAVNLPRGKNLCGCYARPTAIACDLGWLTTAPRSGLVNGLAEMVKNVLIATPEHETLLLRSLSQLGEEAAPDALLSLMHIGIDAKEPLLRADPKERREALIFEYGHTAGHSIEFVSQGVICHGEAVAWGMLVAAEVSRSLGYLDEAEVAHHREIVAHLGLPDPRSRLGGLDFARLRQVLAADNKRGYVQCAPDEVPMVLLKGVAEPVLAVSGHPLVAVPLDTVMTALSTVAAL
jgi:3-dehydroquinate synthetase